MSFIHPSAIVSEGAVIGEGTTVGPFCVIGSKVKLGSNNIIASHVVMEGNTVLGDNNKVFQFASVGSVPQDKKFRGEDSQLIIGNNNTIRECATLQPGTSGGIMKTVIGDDNLFMAYSHVGHDGIIGNHNVIANSVALAGHVTIANYVTIGGMVGIHQFVTVGDSAMIGAGSMVSKDSPPFCIVQGDRAGVVGINKIGLERRGVPQEVIEEVSTLFKKFYIASGLHKEKLENLKKISNSEVGKYFVEFIEKSKRGVTGTRKQMQD